MKSYPLEKFGIYSNIGGLNEMEDSKRIQALNYSLSRKVLQFRIVKSDLLIYLSGVELTKLQVLIGGNKNTKLLNLLQRSFKLQVRSGKLFLLCYNEPVLNLNIYSDHKTKKFYVELEEA